MQTGFLFIITGDPRLSARPAEAIRIAAGVGVWQRMQLAVYLRGPAILSLASSPLGLKEQESYSRHWPILVKSPIYVQANAPELRLMGEPLISYQVLSDAELAELTERQSNVLRF